MGKRNFFLIILFVSLLVFDQLTKFFFSSRIVDLKLLVFRPVHNTGMSFGLFQGNNLFFIFLTILLIVVLFFFRKEFIGSELFLVLIFAGAFGNLLDRIIHGFVIDFIDFGFFPVFNVADSLIFLGVAGIFFKEFFSKKKGVVNKKKIRH